MRFVARFCKSIAGWIDRKFPDRMTTGEVEQKFKDFEARLVKIETAHAVVRVEIAKIKMLAGLEQFTSADRD